MAWFLIGLIAAFIGNLLLIRMFLNWHECTRAAGGTPGLRLGESVILHLSSALITSGELLRRAGGIPANVPERSARGGAEDRVPLQTRPRINVAMHKEAEASEIAARDAALRMKAEKALWEAYNGSQYLAREGAGTKEHREEKGRNLHEEIRLALIAARAGFPARPAQSQDPHRRCDEFTAVINQTLTLVRELSLEEPDSPLKNAGLLRAMRWFLERFERRTGMKTRLVTSDDPGRLSRTLEMACFRVIEEAALNASRHARASTLTVSIQCSPHSIKLEIADDGIGFDGRIPKTDPGSRAHSGLAGMDERVKQLRGVMRVFSIRGRGSRIVAILPYSSV
jgi:signal transduction histidine kinase